MVRQLLHLSVTEFIDAMQKPSAPEVCLEEIEIRPGSTLDGLALQEAPIRREMNVLLVGVHGS